MPWVTGSRANGFRANWREGGRGSPIKHGCTRELRSEAEADARAVAERLKHLAQPQALLAARMTISEVLDRWGASRLSLKKATPERVEEVKDFFAKIVAKTKWSTVGEITADSLDLWRSQNNGTKKAVDAVKAVLRWAERILRMPVDRHVFYVETPKVTKRKQTPMLTEAQVNEIVQTAYRVGGWSVGVAVEHMANYPARPSMIRRAQVQDWDSANRIITYRAQKNGDDTQHRVHPEHAAKLDGLVAGRQPDDVLFRDPWGRQWGAKALPSWFAQNIGEHLLPKGSRGTNKLKKFAMTRTKVAAAGNSELVITMSGHRDPSVVDRHYIEQNFDKQDELLTKLAYVSGSTAGSTERVRWTEREREDGRKRRRPKSWLVSENPGNN